MHIAKIKNKKKTKQIHLIKPNIKLKHEAKNDISESLATKQNLLITCCKITTKKKKSNKHNKLRNTKNVAEKKNKVATILFI